jgi:hypothetical protein
MSNKPDKQFEFEKDIENSMREGMLDIYVFIMYRK